MNPRNFDMDVLRSMVAFADHGTLGLAAARVGRTQAALSLQMRKLEEQAGEPIFERASRKLVLTEAGEVLLSYARRILALNDEAQQVMRQSNVSGNLTFGASQDFGESWLPPVLAQFSKAHPSVGLEVRVDGGTRLAAAVDAGEVDVALALGLGERPNAIGIGHLPLVWIAHRDFEWDGVGKVPLALFTSPCRFRTKAIAELDAAGIAWNIALTSPSLYGVWAAVNAGLGVTVRHARRPVAGAGSGRSQAGPAEPGQRRCLALHRQGLALPGGAEPVEMLRERLSERILELESRTPRASYAGRAARFGVATRRRMELVR